MLKTRKPRIRWQDINMTELDLRKLVEHFSQTNRAEGKSAKTVMWYEEMLSPFIEHLDSTGCEVVLGEFGIESIRDYIVHEQERGLSPHTIQGKVRATCEHYQQGG